MALLLTLLLAAPALAGTPPPNRAGLVVQFGDGSVVTQCVDLGPGGEVSGEELLRRSGLSPIMEYTPMGGSLCQLDGQGCGYPAESCWCQCQGDPCVYWAYYYQEDGRWIYSTLGASSYLVHPGDVQGWAWGAGDLTSGAEPPVVTFDQVCSAEQAAAPASPAADGQAPAPQASAPAAAAESGAGATVPASLDSTAAATGSADSRGLPSTYALFGGTVLLLVAGSTGFHLLTRQGACRAGGQRQQFSIRRAGRLSLGLAIYLLSAAIGVLALASPFFTQATQGQSEVTAGAGNNVPLLLTLVLGLCLAAVLFEVQNQPRGSSSKMLALLGVLVAINAVLRFVEVGIPGPGGFSPIFFLIVLTGYVYGGRFGFLLGALTMAASGLVTGGVGPWLPAQMLAAGWVGLTAPLIRPAVRVAGGAPATRRELVVLAIFAGLWGLAFGFIMNLYFWPYMAGPAGQYWQPGLDLAGTVQRYLAFYLATSLVWDLVRLVGNVLLIAAFGAATLRTLRRFQQRFGFDYLAAPAPLPVHPEGSDRPLAGADPGAKPPAWSLGRGP